MLIVQQDYAAVFRYGNDVLRWGIIRLGVVSIIYMFASGGSSGGGGGGIPSIKKLNTTNGTVSTNQDAIVSLGIENSQGSQGNNEGSETQTETGRNFLSSISGAFVSGDGKIKSPAYFGLIIIVLAVIIGLVYYNRKKSKTS